MSHPFDLNITDLEALEIVFEDELTDEEAERVGGGSFRCGTPRFTTRSIGEEGGWCGTPNPFPKPQPPEATTLALGEEGGDVYTSLATGEEGGFCW
jgi:hypothetical protein